MMRRRKIYSARHSDTVTIGVGSEENYFESRLINVSSKPIILAGINCQVLCQNCTEQNMYNPYIRIAQGFNNLTVNTPLAIPGIVRLPEAVIIPKIHDSSARWTGEIYLPEDYSREFDVYVYFGVITPVVSTPLPVDVYIEYQFIMLNN